MASTDGYQLVSVRAFERRGFEGFCRGGRRWPSSEPALALVTPALFKILDGERMLAVKELDTGAVPAETLEQLPRLDVPPRTYVDEGAQALDEAAKLRAEIAKEKAKAEAAKLRAELEALRAKNAAGESEAKGKAK